MDCQLTPIFLPLERNGEGRRVYDLEEEFGDSVKSKKRDVQINELICKIICHNLCVLIDEMREVKKSDLNLDNNG